MKTAKTLLLFDNVIRYSQICPNYLQYDRTNPMNQLYALTQHSYSAIIQIQTLYQAKNASTNLSTT